MKIIAIDLDGTLLSELLLIQKSDINAIRNAQKRGHIVSIATGRVLFDAQHIIGKFNLDCPIIASNGAQIYVKNEIIKETFINQDTIQLMIQWLNQENIYYQVYLSDKIVVFENSIHFLQDQVRYVVSHDLHFNKEFFEESIKAQIYQYGLQKVSHPIQPRDYDNIIKLMVVSPDLNKLKQTKEYFNQLYECVVSSSGMFNLEVTSKGVDKGIALYELCKYYETTVDNTVVFGDSLNDIPMFNVAGIGIAMGNSVEELFKIATYKTLSNSNCGVSYAFHKYLKSHENGITNLLGASKDEQVF